MRLARPFREGWDAGQCACNALQRLLERGLGEKRARRGPIRDHWSMIVTMATKRLESSEQACGVERIALASTPDCKQNAVRMKFLQMASRKLRKEQARQ